MQKLVSSVVAIVVVTWSIRGVTLAETPQTPAPSSLESANNSSDWPVPPGWPYQMPELVATEQIQPVVVDLNHDGIMEVVVLTPHALRILTPDGAMAPGAWPFEFPLQSTTVNFNPSAANMDSDDDLEIVFSRNQPSLEEPQGVGIHVFNHDGTCVPGWPQVLEGLADRIIVADLDADGNNEVVIGTRRPARVYVLRSDGTSFGSVWPKNFQWWVRAMGCADLDGDGDLEIVVTDSLPDPPHPMYALHHDAAPMQGWPIWLPASPDSQIALGDLGNDGSPEIAFGSFDVGSGSMVHVVTKNGEPLAAAWPLNLPVLDTPWSVAMGDVDADGYLDVLVTGHMREVFAIDRSGAFLPGWPALIPFPFLGAIAYQNIIHAVADMDADGMPEVVVGALIGPCIFNHDGTPLPGANPLPTQSKFPNARLHYTATVADVDLDGDIELFSGIWRTLYAWDFPGPECSVQWPRSSGNLGNTGAVTPPAVDTSEWVLFNACFTGPSADSLPPECECLDFDADSDIDLHDFAALQRAFAP